MKKPNIKRLCEAIELKERIDCYRNNERFKIQIEDEFVYKRAKLTVASVVLVVFVVSFVSILPGRFW